MNDDPREAQLDAALRDLAGRWRTEIPYVARRFLPLLSARGAVGAVAHLLNKPGQSQLAQPCAGAGWPTR